MVNDQSKVFPQTDGNSGISLYSHAIKTRACFQKCNLGPVPGKCIGMPSSVHSAESASFWEYSKD